MGESIGSGGASRPASHLQRIRKFLRDNIGATVLAIAGLLLLAVFLNVGEYLVDFNGAKFRALWVSVFGGSKSPKVLAIFPDSTVSEPMRKGLNIPDGTLLEGEDWTLELMYEEDTPEATARILRDKLRKENNIVLVVGHERSTTAKYLNEHVYEADEFFNGEGPIPLVLPAVTHPDVTSSPRGGKNHILRLPGTDNKQSDALVDLLTNLQPKPQRVVLVVDTENKEYSRYLARELVAKSAETSIVDAQGIDIFSHGFSPARFLEANPDTIVFIGMEVEADIFLRRIKTSPGVRLGETEGSLRLVFTDGVAGETFRKISAKILVGGEFVYLTGPFPVGVEKGKPTPFPTYEGYARLSRRIAVALLEKTKKMKGGVTRSGVLEAMALMMGDPSIIPSEGVGASFDESGENRLGEVHVFEIHGVETYHSIRCSCES